MSKPDITFIIGTDHRPVHLAGLLSSLLVQTNENWEAIIAAEPTGAYEKQAIENVVDMMDDERITLVHLKKHQRDWHQTVKRDAADQADGLMLCFPNDDVYYMPTFAQRVMESVRAYSLDLVYCDWLNPEFGYTVHSAAPTVGHIDVGGFAVSARAWQRTREFWRCGSQTADGEYVEAVVRAGFRHGKMPGVLYVKN
jgi:hypothetical protein